MDQQIVNAIFIGSIYALFAVGYTLVFGILDILNLAHSAVFMLGAAVTYSLAINEILVSGDLAVVRLTWTLRITRNDTPGEAVSREQGMDVFRRQPDGSWKIIRYLAYEVSR